MYDFFKRCFDLLFATLFLLVFSPVYLLTWIIIKIVSPGPAIYKAKRVGKDGVLFDCYKFRSMRVDSGKVRLTTLENDDRIFPFGKFIRKAKIDEMPQVVNILKGGMSVVGPRPEDKDNAAQDPAQFQRLVAFLRSCEYTDQLLTGPGWLHISWSPFSAPRHFVRLGYYK